jgi:pyridoxamine 5'-phosphate oxidase
VADPPGVPDRHHDLGHFREDYQREPLHRADLADDPVVQFRRWWDEWVAVDRYDLAACVLATADARGRPSARYVLCRGFGPDGFVIYTNFESRKGSELAHNPHACLVFGWLEMNRQVRIEGPATVVDDAEADAYWATRPRPSQLGAWASDQSEVLADRAELDRHLDDATRRYGPDGPDAAPVPRPAFWGGYRIGVERAEFWQGRPDRLHDRFEYRRDPSDAGWTVLRLAP